MSKIAIVILADTETHEALGRVVNAMEAVKEFKDAHDDVQLIFDGAGPKWIPELEKPDHKLHGLYTAVKDRISGACDFCAGAFGVKYTVVACGAHAESLLYDRLLTQARSMLWLATDQNSPAERAPSLVSHARKACPTLAMIFFGPTRATVPSGKVLSST